MEPLHACPECLRRSWLLSLLGPYMESAASSRVGRRSPELLRLGNEELVSVVAPAQASDLLRRIEKMDERFFAREFADAECWAICRHDEAYPPGLSDAADGPWALIGRGELALIEHLEPEAAVTVVGSRRASTYGRQVARDLSRELSAAGMIVVSGLAFGIDACAHRGAIDAGGPTIAVLGCGPDTAYPAAHRNLWARCVEGGAVISELPPGSTPWRWTFPARNRVMAALAGMTVVVEAAARSGSIVTADLAAELGRDLGAVPGPVTSPVSAGPNELLAKGARVVRGADDVLDAMHVAGVLPTLRFGAALDPAQAIVLAAVEAGATTPDAVAAATGLSGAEAAAALTRLELLGYLSASAVGTFTRTTQAAPPAQSGGDGDRAA